MFPYDPALASAIANEPQTISDVLQTLHSIDSICIDGDGLKWFNWLYLQVTDAVETRVASGGFTDLDWLAQLDVQFARLYFSALKAWLANQDIPSCWRVLFDSRGQTSIARIQFALAGINAHINHDLPKAIVATCKVTGTTPERSGIHYKDYTAVNPTLESLVETAKTTLHVRLLGDALPPVSHLENMTATWKVTAAREAAWQNAENLWKLSATPLFAASFLDVLDGFTTVIGKALLVSVP